MKKEVQISKDIVTSKEQSRKERKKWHVEKELHFRRPEVPNQCKVIVVGGNCTLRYWGIPCSYGRIKAGHQC